VNLGENKCLELVFVELAEKLFHLDQAASVRGGLDSLGVTRAIDHREPLTGSAMIVHADVMGDAEQPRPS
jgi:hypothetical protein